MVDLERSASHTTMSLFSRPSSTSVRPNASRVAAPGFQFEFGLVQACYWSSCSASFISSAVGAVPWNLGLFSMKETPLPLIGVGDDRRWACPWWRRPRSKRLADGAEVVPVDLDGVPAEGAPLVGQRRDIHDVLHEAVELDPVVVDDRDHVVDLVEGARHGRFPDLPFLDLAVAQHHVRAVRPAVEAVGESHADAERKAFARASRWRPRARG